MVVTYDIFKKGVPLTFLRCDGQLITWGNAVPSDDNVGGSTFHLKHTGGDRDVVNKDKKPPKYGTLVGTCTLAHNSISSSSQRMQNILYTTVRVSHTYLIQQDPLWSVMDEHIWMMLLTLTLCRCGCLWCTPMRNDCRHS